MSLSIITVVYNRRDTVEECFQSLRMQTCSSYEHVIIDGASTDGTLEVLERIKDERTNLVSEPDDGVFDALNKGIKLSSGEIIGIVHSDDVFATSTVLERVLEAFSDQTVNAVYGDLNYVKADNLMQVIRHWKAGPFLPKKLRRGWMPPHPTLFLRKEVFESFGMYDTKFSIAADYEAILRWFTQPNFKAVYIPEVLVNMRVGGQSNSSIKNLIIKSMQDFQAIRKNRMGGLGVLALKNISKVSQFFRR